MLFNLTIEGNLAAKPELRYTPDGTAVARMRVLRTARRRDGNGGWVDGRTVGVDVTCWRKVAERVAHLNAGDTVIVECADDLRAEAYDGRAFLRVSAVNVGVSMRFHQASSARVPKSTDRGGDRVRTGDGEDFDAEAYAEYAAEQREEALTTP